MVGNNFEDLLRHQRMMASKIIDETSMDSKIQLYNLITDMLKGKIKKVHINQIMFEAQQIGMLEEDVLRLMDELAHDSLIKRLDEGFISI